MHAGSGLVCKACAAGVSATCASSGQVWTFIELLGGDDVGGFHHLNEQVPVGSGVGTEWG